MDKIWYRNPADRWLNGFPVGNGEIAGMVFGSYPVEKIALNHEWLWRSKNRNRNVEEKYHCLEEIRRLFFEGKNYEAGVLANEKLGGYGGIIGKEKPNRVDPYQPAGDFFIETDHFDVKDYKRELDLQKAIVKISYEFRKEKYEREIFVHSKLPVLVVFLKGNDLNITSCFSRVDDPECLLERKEKGSCIILSGQFIEGTEFTILGKIISDGNLKFSDNSCSIKNATNILFLITVSVSHNGENTEKMCFKRIRDIPGDIKILRETHIEEYQKLYSRVYFHISDNNKKNIPTDERIQRMRSVENDNTLVSLFFNFGKYLLISGSISGSLPLNLQGKWNEDLNPPWDSDYHFDINLQMNYWAAEILNLPECEELLFDFVKRFIPHGKEVARKLYNCRGVYLPIQTDIWGRATPESRGWDVWIGAAGWISQHFWNRYEFSLDKEFLKKEAYPFLKECGKFYEDYLVENKNGYLVPVPSQSPENSFEGGTFPVSLCAGAYSDIEIIRDVFIHLVEASKILKKDKNLRKKWEKILKKLPPFRIGKYGQLQEWMEDYKEKEPGHRHFSHLYALYPSEQITLEKTPELINAVKTSLFRRIAYGSGATGWSRAWLISFFARLKEPEIAYEHIKLLISHFTTSTLLDLHPPGIFQIDGNLGAVAGICEMLLQSHNGIIRILPCLPEKWKSGKVYGLKARGNFLVDIEWKNNRLKLCRIKSLSGKKCCLKFNNNEKIKIEDENGKSVKYQVKGEIIIFLTDKNGIYEAKPRGLKALSGKGFQRKGGNR